MGQAGGRERGGDPHDRGEPLTHGDAYRLIAASGDSSQTPTVSFAV